MSEQEFLKNYRIDKFERPSIAADIVALGIMRITEEENFRKNQGKVLKLLLIKRGEYPYKNCWALPGGFVRPDETVDETAKRELKEETNVENAAFILADIFSEKNRDPRGWIISNTYLALLDGEKCCLRADTDAWEASWFSVGLDICDEKREGEGNDTVIERKYVISLERDGRSEQTNVGAGEVISLKAVLKEKVLFKNNHRESHIDIVECDELAFDHAKIILGSILKLRQLVEHDELTAFDFLPEKFTLTQLQNVFEQVLDKKLLTANFRRKIADYVLETEEYIEGEGHRPAQLFKRNMEMWK